MENIIPEVSVCHNIERGRLIINVKLPGVDGNRISTEMKKESFCIFGPRNETEYSGCFMLDHEIEPEKTETKFEDGVFRIETPFKGWKYWDRLREGFMGRPVVKG